MGPLVKLIQKSISEHQGKVIVTTSSLPVRRIASESGSCISMVGRLCPATECNEMLTHLYRRASPLPSDSFRRNGNIGGGLHEGPRGDCDLDFQNIPSLSTSSKSRPTDPVPASSWFCSLDTRDLPTPVSGAGEANPGVWPAGGVAVPTTRHRPDRAHTAPGHT